jgi:hypothetical protein
MKLEIAQVESRKVETDVRRELEGESFTEFEISSHPRLRRRRSEAALWKGLLIACDDPKDGQGTWRHVTKHLS